MTFAKYVNHDHKQLEQIAKGETKILLTDFKLVVLIEWMLIFLHIFLFLFAILSLIAVFEQTPIIVRNIFESFTLLFIILLFIFLFLKREINYYLVKRKLSFVWGINNFDKIIVKCERDAYEENDLWGNIIKLPAHHFEEETFLGWKNNFFFHKTLVISAKNSKYESFSVAVNEIYLNSEKKQVILSATLYDPKVKKYYDFIFIFNEEKNTISWSGILPYNFSHGKWMVK